MPKSKKGVKARRESLVKARAVLANNNKNKEQVKAKSSTRSPSMDNNRIQQQKNKADCVLMQILDLTSESSLMKSQIN